MLALIDEIEALIDADDGTVFPIKVIDMTASTREILESERTKLVETEQGRVDVGVWLFGPHSIGNLDDGEGA